MAGYTRQAAANMIAGNTIFAADLNAEFNQLRNAFDAATGHAHDGTTGNGPKISLTASVSGILPVANGGTGGATGSEALTNLGVSTFIKTLLDDADAATARSTLGANNASYLDAGTIADARLPTVMGGKTFNTTATFTGNINMESAAPIIQLKETDTNKFWYLVLDGNNLEVRENTLGTTKFQFHNTGITNFGSLTSTGLIKVQGVGNTTRSVDITLDGSIELFSTAGAYIDFKNAAGDDYDARIVHNVTAGRLDILGGVNSANNLMTSDGNSANSGILFFGTNGSHYIQYNGSDYVMPNGNFYLSNDRVLQAGTFTSQTGNVFVNSAANSHFWHQVNGVNRGLTFYDSANSALHWQLYNSSGSYVRDLYYRESNGQFYINGFLDSAGAVQTGNGRLVGRDGNNWLIIAPAYGTANAHTIALRPKGEGDADQELKITNADVTYDGQSLVRANGQQWNLSIGGSAGTIRNGGTGNAMTFNWSGQGGQPTWVWGGDAGSTGTQMYVYNPSNFSVAYAGNAGSLGGVAAANYSQFSYSGNQSETNFPIGQVLGVFTSGVVQGRREYRAVYLSTNVQYYTLGTNAGTQLSGMWRQIGQVSTDTALYQRVA